MTLKVIGAGLGRTGTASLKVALEQLLGGRCYHMSECFGNSANPPLWLEAARGRPDWDAVFKDYVATVDYPACGFWRELADHYPEAKVVLSVRVLTCGKGASGTGTPRKAHSGSQPCPAS